ncbi:MAG TPA: ABC transporter substrate-binding protein [Candidatus Methylomirabilis sp.]|nr:ABC transporter substrate-binding protein [Candidatus Methylomirabilis sp.]
MRQRLASLAIGIAALAAPLDAEAQPAAKTFRIGVLANALDTADGPLFEAFQDQLRGLGYVEDRNMVIEWRSSEGDYDRLPELAGDLVRTKVDVILAASLQPARAAAEATKTVPIVFVVSADPLSHGLVANLAHPGGNVTGLATYVPAELSERVIQLLREVVPKVSRLAVLMNPANPIHRQLVSQALPPAAQQARIALIPLEVRAPGDLPGVFDAAVRERADAVYVLADVVTFIHRVRIANLALKSRLPAIYAYRSAVEAGGLMSYGPSLRDLFSRAGIYVDKILKGARPGDLPVEQPTKFELVVNVKTAKALGLAIPATLLRQADVVNP